MQMRRLQICLAALFGASDAPGQTFTRPRRGLIFHREKNMNLRHLLAAASASKFGGAHG
jgi:hypothetical protein